MMYTRGSASDYDDWDTEGWTFKDLKPLFLQVLSGKSFRLTVVGDVPCSTE